MMVIVRLGRIGITYIPLRSRDNRLALSLTRKLIDGTAQLTHAIAKYSEIYRQESREDFGDFAAAALEVFDELVETDVVRYERPALPANVLRLATSWCPPVLSRQVLDAYLRAVSALGDSGAGIERVAPIVFGGFRVYTKHFNEADRAEFWKAMIGFLGAQRLQASEESSKFIMNLLLRVRRTVSSDSELYAITDSAVTNFHLPGCAERAEAAFIVIARAFSLKMPRLEIGRWLKAEWTASPVLGRAYGWLARTLEGDKDRLDPWLSVGIHRECARHVTGQPRQIHRICAALSDAARLVPATQFG